MNRIAAALALGLAPGGRLCFLCRHTRGFRRVTEQRELVTILVSIDGFHPDYLERDPPTLSRLAAEGTSAAMRPSFPTKTFPNHWTLVTGLVPDNHGIIANRMEDADRPDEAFTMATVDPYWWARQNPLGRG